MRDELREDYQSMSEAEAAQYAENAQLSQDQRSELWHDRREKERRQFEHSQAQREYRDTLMNVVLAKVTEAHPAVRSVGISSEIISDNTLKDVMKDVNEQIQRVEQTSKNVMATLQGEVEVLRAKIEALFEEE